MAKKPVITAKEAAAMIPEGATIMLGGFLACGQARAIVKELAEFLKTRPEDMEVVMTGRAPTPCVDPLCDYITRMTKIRHPYDQGLNARIGVEF